MKLFLQLREKSKFLPNMRKVLIQNDLGEVIKLLFCCVDDDEGKDVVKKQKKRRKRDMLEEQVCKGMRKKGGRVGKNEKEG